MEDWRRFSQSPAFARNPLRAFCFSVVMTLVVLGLTHAQTTLSKRYGLDLNPEIYPQKTPRETLQSISKAVQSNRMDYLLAHLADPRFVDETVTAYKNSMGQGDEKAKLFLAFDRLVAETKQYFLADPSLLQELRRFGKEAEWDITDSLAVGGVKAIPGRKVFLRKYEERWFLENKQQ